VPSAGARLLYPSAQPVRYFYCLHSLEGHASDAIRNLTASRAQRYVSSYILHILLRTLAALCLSRDRTWQQLNRSDRPLEGHVVRSGIWRNFSVMFHPRSSLPLYEPRHFPFTAGRVLFVKSARTKVGRNDGSVRFSWSHETSTLSYFSLPLMLRPWTAKQQPNDEINSSNQTPQKIVRIYANLR
jgi:hypothetical protein